MVEIYYKFTILCVDVCRTANKDYLEVEDRACLQNCGYNRMYINKVYMDVKREVMGEQMGQGGGGY